MPDLRLVTRLERDGDSALLLRCGVENQTERDAYLLNRVPDHSLRTTPDLLYVTLDRDHRLVRAYKNVPPIPPGMSPTMPVAPYVTALRAGQRFAETIRIPLPVHVFDAYAPLPEKTRPASYRGLQFSLGYYWSVPGMKERTQQIIPGVEVLIPTPPPGARLQFGTLQGEILNDNIAVLEPA